MTEGEKIHRVLEHAIKTNPDQFSWNMDELTPAFDNSLNEYEVQYLCQLLLDNGDVADCITKDGFEIGINEKSKAAFYSKKYLKNKPSQQTTVKVDIGQIQNIADSTINAPVSQSRDDLSRNKTYSNVTSAPTPADTKQKPKTWTTSNIIFVILTTVTGGILVLIFWEQIRGMF